MGLDPLRGASVLLPVPPYPGSPGYLTNGSTRILPHRYFESDGAAKTRRLLSLLSRSLSHFLYFSPSFVYSPSPPLSLTFSKYTILPSDIRAI